MSTLHTDAGQPIAFDVVDPFLHHHTVGAADVDAMGHVNNAVYVAWMDRAAYAHSVHVGYDMAVYQKLGAAFVVRRHEIDYLAEGFEGDRVVVATWPCVMERFTATRRHQIVRISDGRTLVRAHTTWIFIDTATTRPRRMPAELIAAFNPREQGNGSSLPNTR
jgi:acyl-CoA thioester hydrolase